jgi:heterodisulfide reductase subunit C
LTNAVNEKRFISLMLRRAVSEAAEACQQCGKCPSSCPVSKHVESFNPRQIITRISLGKIDELLNSEFLWTCTSCLKCKERCPEKISPYDYILILRTLAHRTNHEHPSGYDDFIKAVVQSGVASEAQAVRARNRERRDRASMGLPPAEKPQDIEKFNEALRSIIRDGVLI